MQKYGKKLQGDHRFTIIIGKDTRLSGYMVESALVAGFVAMGADVIFYLALCRPCSCYADTIVKGSDGGYDFCFPQPLRIMGLSF